MIRTADGKQKRKKKNEEELPGSGCTSRPLMREDCQMLIARGGVEGTAVQPRSRGLDTDG